MSKYDSNNIMECFKMSVDLKKVKEIEEYIKNLEEENNQLKLDFELYKDNHIYKNYEVERKDIVIKELRSWLEEDNDKIKVLDAKDNSSVKLGIMIGLGMCLDKLNELEGKNDSDIYRNNT